jgi:DNA-directed RNA polymerase subunit RPC12/RpoP
MTDSIGAKVLGALLESECLVCGYNNKWLNFTCSECSEVSPLRKGSEFRCEHCGFTYLLFATPPR